MFKFLIQDENGLIKTENGEPVLSCDADDVANAAIDFLGALIGSDLKELISDYNQMHDLIETERAENNKTVQDANDTVKRYKKLAEDYNAMLAISQRYQEQIRDLQKQVTTLKNENAKLQKCVTAKDNEFSKLKTQLNNVKRKNDEIRAENNRISSTCNSNASKLAAKNKAEGLTEAELEERAKLRRIYIDNVTGNLKAQMDNTYIVRPDGTKEKVVKK